MGRKYIQNVAHQFMGQLDIKPSNYKDYSDSVRPVVLWETYSEQIERTLKHRFNASTLGEIASYGYGSYAPAFAVSMERVHQGKVYLPAFRSGHDLLVTLAATAIIAQIATVIHQNVTLANVCKSDEKIDLINEAA